MKLEVKMSAYTSLTSDIHKSYRVEKLVLHHLIFLLIKISKCTLNGSKSNFFHILLPYESLIFAIVMKLCLEPINTYLS